MGAAAGYALGPDDVCAPLNRELACHLARGVTTAEAFRNFLGKGDSPTRGRDGNMHFGAPEHGVFPLVSMLGDLCPVDRRRRAGVQAPARAARRADVLGRRRHEHGRRPRGPQPGGRAEGAGRVRAAVERLGLLHAHEAPDDEHLHGRPDRGRLGHSRDARRRQRRGRHAGRPARRDRAGARRRRPAGSRGGHAAAATATPRTTTAATWIRRRLSDYAEQRDPIERLAARLRLDGLSDGEVEALRAAAADEVAAGLEAAEASPAPDPATILDGVYATKLT